MNSAQTIRWSRLISAVAAAAAAFPACIPAVAADRARVREQVQFSEPGTPVPSPTARPRDNLPSRTFEFLNRDKSISGVVEPFVSPSTIVLPKMPHNARLLEAIDQKRHWIYVQSDDMNRSQTVDEMLGVRDPSEADKKPKTALESFFEDRGQKRSRPDRARETPGAWDRSDTRKDFLSNFS